MKRISIIIIMALLSIVVMTSFASLGKLKRDRALTNLWVRYYNASEKDNIQDMIDILEEVKRIALEKRFTADYFRACDEYVNVQSRRNWKLTDSLIRTASEELHEYGEPFLEIFFGLRHGSPTDALVGEIRSYADALKCSKHPDMYDFYGLQTFSFMDADKFYRLMMRSVDNDYEYILWSLAESRGYECDWVYDELITYFEGRYPQEPFARYMKMRNTGGLEERRAELEKMAEEYVGRGMGAAAEDELLEMRFNEMDGEAASEDYRGLEKDIIEFEARKKALKGDEAAVAEIYDESSRILETLRSRGAAVKIENGDARLVVRNLHEAKVVILKGENSVFEALVANNVRSFYKRDTLKFDIPVLDDGEYMAVIYDGSRELGRNRYDKYTISLGRRLAADGMCIYAADYLTGKPVEKADLLLYDGKNNLVAEYSDFVFDGFTELPGEIYPFRDRKSYRLVCRYEKDGLLHSSRRMSMNNRELAAEVDESRRMAMIVKDRAAYVPGDTVRFKVFMFEESPDGSRAAAEKGSEVLVEVEDPIRNVASKMKLITNEFGSASGSYVIGGDGRNGSWAIRVKNDGYSSSPSRFTVDEFILPSYDLSFNNPEKLYFPGDEIKVTGQIRSYSGHGLGGLNAVALISVKYKLMEERPVEIAPDGSFEISFVAGEADDDYVNYWVEVRLTDNTGETMEFNWNSDVTKEINLGAVLLNPDSGRFELDDDRPLSRSSLADCMLGEGVAELRCMASVNGLVMPGIPIEYGLKHEGKTVRNGVVMSGDTLSLDMSGLVSGLYVFEMKASAVTSEGKESVSPSGINMFYMREDEEILSSPEIDGVIRTSYGDGNIKVQLGSGTGPVWAVVELFGKNAVPLRREIVYVEGKSGVKGSLETLILPHLHKYSDKVLLSVFYFRDGGKIQYEQTFERPKREYRMPLAFSSFVDSALPGQEVSVKMKTAPDAEVAVSVFDASSQKISFNSWENMRLGKPDCRISVSYSYSNGCDGADGGMHLVGYGTAKKAPMMGRNVMARGSAFSYDSAAEAVEEEAVPFQMAETKSSFMDVTIRDDFATTLAFEPFLRPAADGTVELKFRTSDKLSSFIVKALAHDKAMNTAFADREMMVTLPVRVAVAAPQYLYAGDRYVLNASVSNLTDAALKGKVHLEVYDGDAYLDATPIKTDAVSVDIPAGGSQAADFEIAVPENVDTLGLKVVFVGNEYSSDPSAAVHDVLISDGMFTAVPVYPDRQTLTESHSAVLPGGRPADDVIARLREAFVNVSPAGAEYSEISVMDMIREALPVAYESESRDVVSLSRAVYVNFMAAGLRSGDEAAVRNCVAAAMDSVSKLLECANEDGGFGWLEGMPSSPVVTAAVLERVAGLRERRLLDVASHVWGEDSLDELGFAVLDAVRYLDASFFGNMDRPLWYGRLSTGLYLNVRSKFSGVEFDENAARKAAGKKKYKEFRKEVRACLIPKETKTSGDVLSKVRAVRTIIELLDGTPEGFRLGKAWGLSSARDVKRMVRSRDRELKSLKQYAVEHPSGGMYYPNAVMPWRGLLESEAYAHAQICDLFRDAADSYYGDWSLEGIADRIRIWIMLQKETQEWTSDPGFVDALASVYDGSEEVGKTKVAVLSKRYSKPFDEIKASGNGFSVSVDYYKAGPDGSRMRLSEGDSLHVGDNITAVCSLWSGENRSHVRLSVPRPACFRPAAQLSGWSGGWLRPLRYGFVNVSPYSYREVKADRTLYWIDVFPEENTELEEELFVTQEGVFTAPAAEIESVYAPHYRANDAYKEKFTIGVEKNYQEAGRWYRKAAAQGHEAAQAAIEGLGL